MSRYKYIQFTAFVFMCALLVSCAPKERKSTGIMDNPEHHYVTGKDLLDKGKIDEAQREFKLALELDSDYGPALAGKGLVQVKKDKEDGLDLIDDGIREADSDKEKIWCYTDKLRANLSLGKSGIYSDSEMIRNSKKTLDKSKLVDSEAGGPYFYMGEIYLQALEFRPAERMYAEVISLGENYSDQADKRWSLVQKATRAAPQTTVGKEIVLVEEIDRADMAALLVRELHVQRFYTRTQKQEKANFEEPKGVQMKHEDLYKKIEVTDIKDVPLRADIAKVIDMGVKGLQPYPDHTFRPQQPMTKAEVAMLYEDIIIRATGEESLATEYIGDESRFPDVPSSHYAFNAIMLCTTRGLLKADVRSGGFKPNSRVSGIDALLSIKKLKEMLRLF